MDRIEGQQSCGTLRSIRIKYAAKVDIADPSLLPTIKYSRCGGFVSASHSRLVPSFSISRFCHSIVWPCPAYVKRVQQNEHYSLARDRSWLSFRRSQGPSIIEIAVRQPALPPLNHTFLGSKVVTVRRRFLAPHEHPIDYSICAVLISSIRVLRGPMTFPAHVGSTRKHRFLSKVE
jgi:hypothetical protein